MKYIIALFFVLIVHLGLAQDLIRGKVSDGEGNDAVAGATVYINNSTIRTSASRDGQFTLRLPNAGNYELVVSAIGYELSVIEIKVSGEVQQDVVLQKKVTEIEEVVISPFLKDGWKEWGAYFTETFIGTMDFAKQTKILNPEVLRFRYSTTSKVLTVSAGEPIKIANRALGYDIDYDLHTYRMDFNTRYLYYEGFASFQERKRVSRKMRQNREGAYMSFARDFDLD